MTYTVSGGTLNPTHSLTHLWENVMDCSVANSTKVNSVFDFQAYESLDSVLSLLNVFKTPSASMCKR